MLETSARLLRLLSLLQVQRDWSGPELADRLGVTTRTVRNDVERLRSLGYPVDATRGANGGYRLGVGATTPPLLLDDDEAVAVAVALSTAASASVTGIEEASVRALAKLEQLLPSRLRRRVGALQRVTVGVRAGGAPVDATTLTAIAAGCRDHEGIRFDYRRHDGSASRRAVEPHRLVHLRRRWYLLAWDLERDDWRTFRVDRISLPKNHRGEPFTPRDLPADGGAGQVERAVESASWAYRARLLVHEPAESVRGRLPGAVDVEPVDGRHCLVDVGSDTAHQLARFIGMIDADFSVVDPDRHGPLLDQLRLLADRYRRAADDTAGAGRVGTGTG